MFNFEITDKLSQEQNSKFASALVQMGVRSVRVSPTHEQATAAQTSLIDRLSEDELEAVFARHS
jgi:hypothetical protein